MKHNRHSTTLWLRATMSCVIVVFAAAATIGIMKLTQNDTTPKKETSQQSTGYSAGRPQFSFNAGAAPGWRQGPTDKVSMALFSNDTTSGCWTSIEHKSEMLDGASELQKIRAVWDDNGYMVTENTPVPLRLQTTTDSSDYTLTSFTVSSATTTPVLGGQMFSYFPLAGGSVKIQAYCNTADQLSTIPPALQAVVFDPSK